MPAWNLQISLVKGKQGTAVLNKKKQENFDQVHAKNPDNRAGVRKK
jgi:hypothetical protein